MHNNCCPPTQKYISEGEFSTNLLPQLPRSTQAIERLHLETAWIDEFPASTVFRTTQAWQHSLRWPHYIPKTQLDVHPSHYSHLPHLKYFKINSTAVPACLDVVSPNVSTSRYMTAIENFHRITTSMTQHFYCL